jgi:uncharacterized membrane protein YbhN (UPF0104 family)
MPEALNVRRLVRRLVGIALVLAVVTLVVALAPGLDDIRDALGANPWWMAAAVLLEALSCVSYVVMFRAVFCRSLSWATSWKIGWSELAVGSLVPASGAGGLALGAWVLHAGGMPSERIARRSVAFFILKSAVNFVAVFLLGTLMAVGLIGPHVSLWLTALPAGLSLLVIAGVVVLPRLGPGSDPPPDAMRLRRWISSARRAVIDGTAEAVAIARSGDLVVFAGSVGYWVFDNAVLWATFNAVGDAPPLSVILLGYLIGQLGGLLPLPGGLGGIDGGLIGTLIVFGAPATATVAAVVAYRVILFWLPLGVGGAAFVSLRRQIADDQPLLPGGREPATDAGC